MDGYGIYPERPPQYQVIFAFLEEDENRGPVCRRNFSSGCRDIP